MSVVWKFQLEQALNSGGVEMPAQADLLYVGIDPSGDPCVWAACSPEAPRVLRRIQICPTGGEPRYGTYVGSFVTGPLVFHVFDGGES